MTESEPTCMSGMMQRIKEKLSGSNKSNSKARSKSRTNPISKSRSESSSPDGSSNGRVIPPEPVQQKPDGLMTDNEAEPAVQVHNLARANKMVPKIEYDERLAHDAQVYAQTLASTGKMEHSDTEAQGENLYMSTGDATYEDAVQSWMNEEKKYNGEKVGEGNLADWGHFSQCLWHSTKYVGMGKAKADNGNTYVVARYSPPGNSAGGKPF